ncbi:hypothetical protein I215_10985 [Galbibacter marinus]|uniref:Lipocalin-like domain-containing protein n=1 Tax=Galbibacter marinus TaxID=555500 RepID=K2QJ45_9FLAO|nr:hypothetical protein [Galbibacter marinus]EKF54707.1 hypothetical protein I215_10985 [Galbibacter marinus]
MNKFTTLLSKIASSLNIEIGHYDDVGQIIGRWEAISYEEKLYENGKLSNEDILMYSNDSYFEMVFKKNNRFIQVEKFKNIGQDMVEKSSRTGTYSIKGGQIILVYGSISEGSNTVTLDFDISNNELITINDYQQSDLDDVYRHVSKRVFLKI